MNDVNKVFITKEVSEKLGITASYLIRVAKKLYEDGVILPNEMRSAGNRNYLFSESAVEKISKVLKH